MNETTVNIEKGDIVLKQPNAGQRNKALIEAESAGNGKPSQTVFITKLLPLCVKSHPFGTVPISQALDSLSVEDYDKVSLALSELMKPKEGLEKN